MKKKLLFIDRDGTLIEEPPEDYQVDSLEKLMFLPGVMRNLFRIAQSTNYEWVMITNQDGLGTDSFPENTFWPAHDKMMQMLVNEGIVFENVIIDRTFKHENSPTRKPGTALLTQYLEGDYDLENSIVIGDRLSDIQLAKNLGGKGIMIGKSLDTQDDNVDRQALSQTLVLSTDNWDEIGDYICSLQPTRTATVSRTTKETDIQISLNLDGTGKTQNETGIGFFDHMLDQLGKHSKVDLSVKVKGDLHIDEHHTIEDAAIALGEAFKQALGDKRGIERYGCFQLPMDDSLAQVAIDFSGRSWLVYKAKYRRERVGGMPTEMVEHFFKSFADSAMCNLNIHTKGKNAHHMIEATFKGVAKAIRLAIRKIDGDNELPSTKGML